MSKVLFTASTYSHIDHFHLPYLNAFRERGWTVHVACGDAPDALSCAHRCFSLPFRKKLLAPSNFRAALYLRRLIRKEDYTLITTHTSLAAFFTRLALLGMKRRPKVVNVCHGYLFDDDTPTLKKSLLLNAERLTAPVTDLVLTMNQWDYEAAKKYKLGKRVEPIDGIGVPFSTLSLPDKADCAALRRELDISEDSFVLLCAAELSSRKSQDVLLRAMVELPDHVFLVLAGKGGQEQSYRALARELGVEQRVRFAGYVENMSLWYGMADAVISASRSEGLPFNIMEAMYLGLPIIASGVKGHTDLITDGESGFLYPYGDSAACAEAVRRLLSDPAAGAAVTRQAKYAVLLCGLNHVLPNVMARYESVCAAPVGAAVN